MAKAAFKARRVVFDGLSAWAIVWYHWCRLPLRRWGRIRMCSRYALQVRRDAELYDEVSTHLYCRHCGLVRYVHKTMLPTMFEESALTLQLLEVRQCE